MTAPKPAEAVPLCNPANLLTLSRLVLVPVFLFALFAADGTDPLWRATAALIFAVASLTDRFDGDLARRRGQVTNFGKIADPIADKALIGGALVGLSMLGELPWWITLVIAFREVGVTALRFWVLRHGVIPASRGGKVKAFAQAVAIWLFVLPLPAAADPALWAVMGIALALTVVTGADYVMRALRLRAAGAVAVTCLL
ncbi:MAG TPA: CDP-diacylglycerol--glycerol-3-phosphate 3-phosphatidyltransferase [Pseudonocardiaceae bacterium]|nr:CDP-diacylglycerol--glycerol-3-phosphate 3-phosphatidyltransferase [Pseudonocardiaceae bacterium]